MDNDKVLKIPEAAALLHCSTWSIGQMCRQNILPHYKCGNRYLFRESSLISWIANQEAASMIPKQPDILQFGR